MRCGLSKYEDHLLGLAAKHVQNFHAVRTVKIRRPSSWTRSKTRPKFSCGADCQNTKNIFLDSQQNTSKIFMRCGLSKYEEHLLGLAAKHVQNFHAVRTVKIR